MKGWKKTEFCNNANECEICSCCLLLISFFHFIKENDTRKEVILGLVYISDTWPNRFLLYTNLNINKKYWQQSLLHSGTLGRRLEAVQAL